MRKLLITMLLVCLLLPARAEQPEAARAWFDAQYAALVPYGAAAERTEETFPLLLPDGETARSLCLTVEGDIRFGRYAQITRAALLDEAGAELGLDAVFADLDALQEYLDAYVEENVLDALNTYLDAADLLPVPLDCVSFDAYGVTFHYPGERFQFFSGHAGAVQLMWYELADFLLAAPLLAPGDGSELDALRGSICGLRLGEGIDGALARFGQVTEPDILGNGLIYEFESPLLRGAQAIAENDAISAVREARFQLFSLYPGITREEAEAALGDAAGEAREVTAEEAEMLRLRPGSRIDCEDISLIAVGAPSSHPGMTLYFDPEGRLYMIEFWLCK